jgi:HPt (histidine-containing phosphotransfer) domain-containing protein
MAEPLTLDPEAIANLRDLGGADFLREIVGIFLSDTPTRLLELDQSLQTGDLQRFARAAHSIKGSSSNLGATALMQAADRLETKARQSLAGVEPDLAAIKAEYQRAKAALEGLCADAGAVSPPSP